MNSAERDSSAIRRTVTIPWDLVNETLAQFFRIKGKVARWPDRPQGRDGWGATTESVNPWRAPR